MFRARRSIQLPEGKDVELECTVVQGAVSAERHRDCGAWRHPGTDPVDHFLDFASVDRVGSPDTDADAPGCAQAWTLTIGLPDRHEARKDGTLAAHSAAASEAHWRSPRATHDLADVVPVAADPLFRSVESEYCPDQATHHLVASPWRYDQHCMEGSVELGQVHLVGRDCLCLDFEDGKPQHPVGLSSCDSQGLRPGCRMRTRAADDDENRGAGGRRRLHRDERRGRCIPIGVDIV